MEYSFIVANVKEIDVVDISVKFPDDSLVISTSNTDKALLLLPNSFLEKYKPQDDQVVSNEALSKHWGCIYWDVYYQEGKPDYKINSSTPAMPNHRAMPINMANIDDIKGQLTAVRDWEFQRRKNLINVKVNTI